MLHGVACCCNLLTYLFYFCGTLECNNVTTCSTGACSHQAQPSCRIHATLSSLLSLLYPIYNLVFNSKSLRTQPILNTLFNKKYEPVLLQQISKLDTSLEICFAGLYIIYYHFISFYLMEKITSTVYIL